ncbi:MAG: hypothetical protein R3F37_02190 [Candidatus Competibacteraceae bacterium]
MITANHIQHQRRPDPRLERLKALQAPNKLNQGRMVAFVIKIGEQLSAMTKNRLICKAIVVMMARVSAQD